MPYIARLGDTSTHGGKIITASPNTNVDGIAAARVGDSFDCPLNGHGINPIVSGSQTVFINGEEIAYAGSVTACGAVIETSQENSLAGG